MGIGRLASITKHRLWCTWSNSITRDPWTLNKHLTIFVHRLPSASMVKSQFSVFSESVDNANWCKVGKKTTAPRFINFHNTIQFFLKMGNSLPLFCLFLSFQTNNTILTTNKCEKCPSRAQCWDSNPLLLEHESSPITSLPGLPP